MSNLLVNYETGGSFAVASGFRSAAGIVGGTFRVNVEGSPPPRVDYRFRLLACPDGGPNLFVGLGLGPTTATSSNPTQSVIGLAFASVPDWTIETVNRTFNFSVGPQEINSGIQRINFPELVRGGTILGSSFDTYRWDCISGNCSGLPRDSYSFAVVPPGKQPGVGNEITCLKISNERTADCNCKLLPFLNFNPPTTQPISQWGWRPLFNGTLLEIINLVRSYASQYGARTDLLLSHDSNPI